MVREQVTAESETDTTTESGTPEWTIDKLHRETGIPLWALEIAFGLSTLGMLDEETMAGVRVIPHAARYIAEHIPSDTEQLIKLRDWKESAMTILAQYDAVAESFGGRLGSSKMENLERGVGRLRQAGTNALATLESERDKLCVRCRRGDSFVVNGHVFRKLGDKFDGAALGCDAARLHTAINALREALQVKAEKGDSE